MSERKDALSLRYITHDTNIPAFFFFFFSPSRYEAHFVAGTKESVLEETFSGLGQTAIASLCESLLAIRARLRSPSLSGGQKVV